MLETSPIVLRLPFRGRWIAGSSPANRAQPRHSPFRHDVRYRLRRCQRTRPFGKARLALGAGNRAPEVFVGFDLPILAPASGTVVAAIDGELDHEARRSQLTLIPYALSQAPPHSDTHPRDRRQSRRYRVGSFLTLRAHRPSEAWNGERHSGIGSRDGRDHRFVREFG